MVAEIGVRGRKQKKRLKKTCLDAIMENIKELYLSDNNAEDRTG